jgi:hypothetical protein
VSQRPITDIIGVQHATADLAIVERERPSDDLLLGLFRFRNICKKVLAHLPGSALIGRLLGLPMSAPNRPAHKLIVCVKAYLEFRLASRESCLRVGYREFRWDAEAVALRNAINYINQAQISEESCPCPYCAGAPFYASKKPVTSVGLAQAKRMSS